MGEIENKMTSSAFHIFYITSVLYGVTASYDEYLTCDRLYQTRRTARVLDHVPCNMKKQSYCEYKGSSYPEHAIWRFKEENKALMRRLYGDVDSTEVYREMRSNNLFGETTMRKGGEGMSSSYAVNMVPFDENMFNGLHYNIRVGSGLAMVKNAKDESIKKVKEPSFRNRSRTRARTTKQTTESTTSSTVVTVQSSTSSTVSRMSTTQYVQTTDMPSTVQPTTMQYTEQQQTIQTIQPTTTDAETSTVTTTEQQPFFTQSEPSESVSTLSQFTQSGSTSVSDEVEDWEGFTERGETPQGSTQNQFQTTIKEYEDDISENQEDDENVVVNTEQILVSVTESAIEEEFEELEDLIAEIDELEVAEEDLKEEEEDEEEEAMEEEEQQQILYTGESINACPVYEEVKAPFWANNTRNQVLALLNLYPFEQYIHMERCKDEGEQMLCRPGCRCEQQYRLHRLLAFDPNNECRGIFSDWFRFPSFCLCKCYNVPEQILASINRLPRKLADTSQQKIQKIAKKKSTEKKKKHGGPGPTHNSNPRLVNHRISKESKSFQSLELQTFDAPQAQLTPEASIPAIFPYEGKAAIMAELNRLADRVDTKLNFAAEVNEKKLPHAEEIKDLQDKEMLLELAEIADEHIDNTVESDQTHFKKSSKEARTLDDHFFYNNPIVEFKLPDGTTGSVVHTPRKK